MLELDTLLTNPPKLHDYGGTLISDWRIDDSTCSELRARLSPQMKTMETGAGLSTIIFAASGWDHTCIVPDSGLVERIKDFCRGADIDLSAVSFVIAKSCDVIHQYPPLSFDLVLIDGCHGFPSIFVDFCYASKALKIGGVLILDDMHIYTCHQIHLPSNSAFHAV
jgi:predicted O-methyltransferase YrrM